MQGRVPLSELGQRAGQVFLDVVGQGPEGRDVQDPGLVRQPFGPQEPVQGPEKPSQCLSGARGGRDERVPALADERPALCLRRRGGTQHLSEPGLHARMEGLERIAHVPGSPGDIFPITPRGAPPSPPRCDDRSRAGTQRRSGSTLSSRRSPRGRCPVSHRQRRSAHRRWWPDRTPCAPG